MDSNLKGRLRNTNLPKSKPLFPLFEAVVNSIHSIDDKIEKYSDFNLAQSYIKIEILRSSQQSTDDTKGEVIGFNVIDNGIGFTAENYHSFETLDTDYKISKGCRGIGRLLWLKMFNAIHVDSVFHEGTTLKRRTFKFNAEQAVFDNNVVGLSGQQKYETIVTLNTIKNDYVKYLPKKTSIIARELIEHCLWYFIRPGGAPDIEIYDGAEKISLTSEYDNYMLSAAKADTIKIKKHEFEITHVKLTIGTGGHSISYSAADRLVKTESLAGKIPGLFDFLEDENGKFYYMCFVSSDYLTEHVTPERLDFNIPDQIENSCIPDEISFSEIRKAIIEESKKFLDVYLQENKKLGIEKFTQFIDNEAPRYRPLMRRLTEDDKIVDPKISNKELDLRLHAHLYQLESELIAEGHSLMIPRQMESKEEYTQRLQNYLEKAQDVKQSDLANYVFHRKTIIDLLSSAITLTDEGKYVKEDVIHNLLMPMQTESDELFDNESNLWLIDERLAFHHFMASNKPLTSMPITDSCSTKKPDILSLNIYDNPLLLNDSENLPLGSISVIEIKRPMRDDIKEGETHNPIEQVFGYLDRIRAGKVKTKSGRLIPESPSIPGFCYILCDITETVKRQCKNFDLKPTAEKDGYFGYNQNYNAYVEVISFDRLLNIAKQRNKAFFDKLGLPTN